jgi:hypothetical protein
VNRRASVVQKPWQRERCRARAAAQGVRRLDEQDGVMIASERDGCGETVGAGADDNGIVLGSCRHPSYLRRSAWR